ncbi:unnamed protein product, partial [Choristocarpus tenellus]
MYDNPRLTPWRDWKEWEMVKGLLFSPDPNRQCRGIQHVALWRTRGMIPHAVESTSRLVEFKLNDLRPGWEIGYIYRSEEELRLISSMVVIRAVNGLTGHVQKSMVAAPVASLAKEIGIPTWIVDIRHEAAHKELPTLVTLRLAADFLLTYFYEHYWSLQTEHMDFLVGAFGHLLDR